MRPGQVQVWAGFWLGAGLVTAVLSGQWWLLAFTMPLAVFLYMMAGWLQRRADQAEAVALRGGGAKVASRTSRPRPGLEVAGSNPARMVQAAR